MSWPKSSRLGSTMTGELVETWLNTSNTARLISVALAEIRESQDICRQTACEACDLRGNILMVWVSVRAFETPLIVERNFPIQTLTFVPSYVVLSGLDLLNTYRVSLALSPLRGQPLEQSASDIRERQVNIPLNILRYSFTFVVSKRSQNPQARILLEIHRLISRTWRKVSSINNTTRSWTLCRKLC